MHSGKLLDRVGRRILKSVQENARITFSDLGRAVGLSSPAAAERVHRMEVAGFIKGYRTLVNEELLGFSLTAFINVSVFDGNWCEADEAARALPEVFEIHHVTGEYGLILKAVAADAAHLDEIVRYMSRYGKVSASVLLSSPVAQRPLVPFYSIPDSIAYEEEQEAMEEAAVCK
jgi:Lrp/AsnC family leucine-responsive transcriptional regulator